MTGIQAARVAADLRQELGAEVQIEDGHYGEFKVFVDGEPVVTGGPLGFLGVLPSVGEVRDAVAARLSNEGRVERGASGDPQARE